MSHPIQAKNPVSVRPPGGLEYRRVPPDCRHVARVAIAEWQRLEVTQRASNLPRGEPALLDGDLRHLRVQTSRGVNRAGEVTHDYDARMSGQRERAVDRRCGGRR